MKHQVLRNDTIAAIATATGAAAVGLLRISGPDALVIVDRMTNGTASRCAERNAKLCVVTSDDGQIIDEVLLTVFHAPRSYTGETVCEIAGHGGILVMRALLERSLACGARLADPGEFTQQAFFNGKLDLTQAEGIMDLISAQTHFALRAAHEQREGKLGKRTETLRDEILECLAHVEAYIDFPEEDISPQVGSQLSAQLRDIRQSIEELLATADRGRILRDGIRTVIFGAPNTGKSSLLNCLLGYERAIVSDIAGTTRDTIEERVNVGGVMLRLIDTAGIREHTNDQIEIEGMRRSSHQRETADLALAVFDASIPCPSELPVPASPHQHLIIILNKCDMGMHPSWEKFCTVRISCINGEGLPELEKTISNLVIHSTIDSGDSLVAINARHQNCLRRAEESLESALAQLAQSTELEIVSLDLRSAMDALGEIAGKIDSDDVLGVIFSRFCIGK